MEADLNNEAKFIFKKLEYELHLGLLKVMNQPSVHLGAILQHHDVEGFHHFHIFQIVLSSSKEIIKLESKLSKLANYLTL